MKIVLCIFAIFLNILIYPNTFNIIFIPENFQDREEEIKSVRVLQGELYEFPLLADYVKFLDSKIDITGKYKKICSFTDQRTFNLDTKKLLKILRNSEIIPDLIIFIIKNNNGKAQGGTIGKENFPIILITSSAKRNSIKHEFAHAVFGLGDEYGGMLTFPPSEKEIKHFKNLSLSKDNPEWLRIKEITGDDKIGFYEGGLGRKKGVYHSYPECLMQNLESELCPVCSYYAVERLKEIKGR